ncbi:hypothetical protein DFH06DRAFT_1087669 [Mycena polygramma]|nr:hypothetical protein DFH06DRAFT_1087669 [Mycena polygramma]
MSDSELYSRLLFPKKQGYPLFHPAPFDDLPDSVRKIGTEIGDVGRITQNGSFDPIFNICRTRDDPSNRFGVPPAFEQIPLGPDAIATSALAHLPGSHICNTSISKRRLDVDAGLENVFFPFGAGAVVEVSIDSKQTGLLLLPDGASRWDLRRQGLFRDYALKHAQNWYAFVNGDLQYMVGNGDLYLVTGVTKSTSWSVAAVEDHSSEGKISLKLKAAQAGSAGAAWAWESESGGSSVNSGPRRRLGEESWKDNQTVFLRGFKVAVRSKPTLRRAPKIRDIVNSKWSDIPSKGTFIPFSTPPPKSPTGPKDSISSLTASRSTSDSDSGSDDESLSSSEASKFYHPSTVINEFLLDCVVDAKVAVTHDNEWASILSEEENEIPGDSELIRRVLRNFRVNNFNGGACLQAFNEDAEYVPIQAGRETSQVTPLSPPSTQVHATAAHHQAASRDYNPVQALGFIRTRGAKLKGSTLDDSDKSSPAITDLPQGGRGHISYSRGPQAKQHYRTMLNNTAQAWGNTIEYTDSQVIGHGWDSIAYVDRVEYGRGSGESRGSARECAARMALVTLGVVQV